jgi:uncharacterized membrane protein
MASLYVLKFSSPDGSVKMLNKVQTMQNAELIKIQDAAIVTWPTGKKSPKTKQLSDLVGVGACKVPFGACCSG